MATGNTWVYGYDSQSEMVSANEYSSSSKTVLEESVAYTLDVLGTGWEDGDRGRREHPDGVCLWMWNAAKKGAAGNAGADVMVQYTVGPYGLPENVEHFLNGNGLHQVLASVGGSLGSNGI